MVLLIFLVGFSYAYFGEKYVGTASFQFLKICPDASIAALGSTHCGFADSINTIHYNPAGVEKIKENTGVLTHTSWLQDIYYESLTLSYFYEDIGTFVVGLNFLTMESIEKYDNTGYELGQKFRPIDLAINFSHARKLKWLTFGANVKFIYSQLDDASAFGFAADIGLLTELQVFYRKLQIGLSVQNIGPKTKYLRESFPLPFNIKTGVAIFLPFRFLTEFELKTGLDLNMPIDNKIEVNLGNEVKSTITEDIFLSIRTGYSRLTGFCAGFGVSYTEYEFNYAWTPYGELGTAHRFSIKFAY